MQNEDDRILFENCSSPEELYKALDTANLIVLHSKAQRLFQNQRTVTGNDAWRVVYVQAYRCARRLYEAAPKNLPEPPSLRREIEVASRSGIQDIRAWAFKAHWKAGQGKRAKKWTVELADEAILPVIKKYGKTPLILTARFLHGETGCPKSTLVKTENWKALQGIKRKCRDAQGKALKKPVHLSGEMLRIAEQSKDGSVKLHVSHKKKNIENDE